MAERISLLDPPETRVGHEARYRMVPGWLQPYDFVVDAACGVGYGALILGDSIRYLGVDRSLAHIEVQPATDRTFIERDLNTWAGPEEPADVAVGFETLEHLADPTAYVGWTRRARLVFLSVPFPPTLGANPYHLRDYAPADVRALYAGMTELAYFEQPAEHSGVWVFGR